MEKQSVQFKLGNICMMLSEIGHQEMHAHVEACADELARFIELGPVFDPATFRHETESGRLEDARLQLKIAEALYEVAALLAKREAHARCMAVAELHRD